MHKTKKSQTAIEFMFLVGVAFSIVMIFMVASKDQVKEINTEKEQILVKDLAFKVQNEINLAAVLDDGYSRNFEIPNKLETIDYAISTEGGILTISTANEDSVLFIPKVNGSIQKGANSIRKENGILYING